MMYSIYQVRRIVKKEANHGKFRNPSFGRTGKGGVAELREGPEAGRREEAHGQGPHAPARAFLQGKDRALEAWGDRRRQGVRRRRHRALLRPSRPLSRGRAFSHHAGQPPDGMVLHDRGPAQGLRHLGQVRQRADQHARVHRGYHSPGHQDRIPAALL